MNLRLHKDRLTPVDSDYDPLNDTTLEDDLVKAVAEAMTDWVENGGHFRKVNPCIYKNYDETISYGSTLYDNTCIIPLYDDGFGNWTPETLDDIEDAAKGFAEVILTDYNV